MEVEQKNEKKLIRNFIFFILLILLTLWILLKDQSMSETLAAFENVIPGFIIAGIASMGLYILCDAINIKRNLKAFGIKTNIINNIKYASIGFFFSAITPAASGGQPMQIYYMHKDGIAVSKSTVSLLVNLLTTQIATIGLGIFSLIFNLKYMNQALIILFIVGIILNGTALTLLIISIWSRRLSRWIINFSVKVLKFFKIKKVDKIQEKLENELTKYHSSSKYIRKRTGIIIKAIITTAVQYIAYYAIAYFTYRALGFNEFNAFQIITMQAVVFATVSGLPSPGAVGVSEGAFIEIFRHVYPETTIKSATLLNRGMNFYIFVIISGIMVLISEFQKKKIAKANEIGDENK